MDGTRCLDNKVKYQATVVEEGNPEEAIQPLRVQHEARRPEDLLLLGRLCVEAEDLAVAHHLVRGGGFFALPRPVDFWPFPSAPRERDSFPVHPWTKLYTPYMHKQNKLLDKT